MSVRLLRLSACLVALGCSDSVAPSTHTARLDLVGPNVFQIIDRPVNPGCAYHWVIQARGTSFTLRSGRMIRVVNGIPTDTVYRWDGQTIRPLFTTPTISGGETRTSGEYSSTGRDLQSFEFDTEFDYVASNGETGVVLQRLYCLRL
jgi:hypothetical protein